MTRYYFLYDRWLDVAHPITKADADKGPFLPTSQHPRMTAKEVGYDLPDGEILVAVKRGDLERLLDECIPKKTILEELTKPHVIEDLPLFDKHEDEPV